MISKLLRLLLLIYAVTGWIRCQGQTDSITLSNRQFDYFAAKLVEHKHLKLDTAALKLAISDLRGALADRNKELKIDSLMFTQKDELFAELYRNYQDIVKKQAKSEKKIVFWRRTAVILGVTVVIETLILLTDH